jgi:predicted O-methyltransferase YrrM
MVNVPQRVMKVLKGKVSRIRATRETSRLFYKSSGTEKLLGNVLYETLRSSITISEKDWIRKIETLRENLNTSKDQILVADYGAGKSNLGLTQDEMNKGRLESRIVGDICRAASKPYLWCLLLFKLIRNFKPTNCLELGTCLGISASYQAAGLKLNGSGHLITLEGASALASLATKHFDEFGLNTIASVIVGRFNDTLGRVLNEQRHIDYAFIDGHHDEAATISYFNQIMQYVLKKAVLVFDDINWSEGMKTAWETIIRDERLKICVNLRQIGICIIDDEITEKKNFSIPFI